MKLKIIFGTLITFTSIFAAEDSLTERRPWWVYGGISPGYLNLSSALESDKDGYLINAKLLSSYYFRNVILDLGAGWFTSEIESHNKRAAIITRAIYVDFSPRYRINRRWHVGPLLNTFFGTDVSFSERVEYSDDTKISNFLGIRADYEFPNSARRFRVGAQIMRDLDLENKQVYIAQVDFQFGFATPFTHEKKVIKNTPKVAVTNKETITVTLDTSQDIYFAYDSDVLSEKTKDYLEHLANFLLKNKTRWKTLVVEGHTDVRGSDEYNLDLSKRRAASVKNELIANKISPELVNSVGHGKSRPIDKSMTEEAHQKNRRVDILLNGVKDAKALMKSLENMANHFEDELSP